MKLLLGGRVRAGGYGRRTWHRGLLGERMLGRPLFVDGLPRRRYSTMASMSPASSRRGRAWRWDARLLAVDPQRAVVVDAALVEVGPDDHHRLQPAGAALVSGSSARAVARSPWHLVSSARCAPGATSRGLWPSRARHPFPNPRRTACAGYRAAPRSRPAPPLPEVKPAVPPTTPGAARRGSAGRSGSWRTGPLRRGDHEAVKPRLQAGRVGSILLTARPGDPRAVKALEPGPQHRPVDLAQEP